MTSPSEPDPAASYETALPIHIRGLTKQYGNLYALDSVDLDVESGEFLTLLGPSGSGKTTLLMAIAGFNRPDAGSIRFGETEMVLTPPHKREVGMVFQSYALFPHMTVAENIGFPLKLRRVNRQERAERVAEALDTVQLIGLGERNIDQLSGGQRQRVALARAFVFRPRILLMDEPLSALDKKLRERMQIELKQLHRQLGVTTVYVTHDQREALTMSDRIAVINDGRLIQVDTPEVIYNKPVNAFVADFIGESTMLPLVREGDGLSFDGQWVCDVAAGEDCSDWALVIRPERLLLQSDTGHESTRSNDALNDNTLRISGTVKEFVFQGDSAFVLVSLADGSELGIRSRTGSSSVVSELVSGSSVSVILPADDIIVIPSS